MDLILLLMLVIQLRYTMENVKSGIRVLTDQSVAMEPEHNKTSTIYLKKSKPSIVVITDPSESMKNTKNERQNKY